MKGFVAYRIMYEVRGKTYTIIIEAQTENQAIKKCEKIFENLGFENEAEILTIDEVE